MGPARRGGNDRKLSNEEAARVVEIRREHATARLQDITQIFNFETYDVPELVGVSEYVISRTISEAHITRKKTTLIPAGADPEQQMIWLEDMARIDPHFMIDVDENSTSRDKLRQIMGWAKEGERAYAEQQAIEILGYTFSTISATTPFGFLCWQTYEGTISSIEFREFIIDVLGPMLRPYEDFVILDNAAIHGTLPVRVAMEEATGGNFDFPPPFSYDLKPCERGLSMIKKYVVARVDRCHTKQDAVDLIDEAFRAYSVEGEHGHKMYHHFNHFFKYHYEYLQENFL